MIFLDARLGNDPDASEIPAVVEMPEVWRAVCHSKHLAFVRALFTEGVICQLRAECHAGVPQIRADDARAGR
jgi:hypothetical protein